MNNEELTQECEKLVCALTNFLNDKIINEMNVPISTKMDFSLNVLVNLSANILGSIARVRWPENILNNEKIPTFEGYLEFLKMHLYRKETMDLFKEEIIYNMEKH